MELHKVFCILVSSLTRYVANTVSSDIEYISKLERVIRVTIHAPQLKQLIVHQKRNKPNLSWDKFGFLIVRNYIWSF